MKKTNSSLLFKAILFVFLVLIPFQSLFCQEFIRNDFKGIVLDANSNKAIPFVHFTYANSKGFTSNEKGVFHVVDSLKSIQVKASCIGYKTKLITLNANENHTLYLEKNIERLNEVELVYVNQEKELLKKVVENIPLNYPNQNETITGVIHEGVFVDSLFLDTIYNASYKIAFNKLDYTKKRKTGNLSLTKGEAKFHKIKDSIPTIFYGVLHSVHSNDLVMRRYIPLNLKKAGNYKLNIKDTLLYDNLKLIQLDFEHDNIRGNLLIDSKSYAVARGNYWLKGKTSAIERLKGFERKERHYSVHYDKYADKKWRLKYIYFLGRYAKKIGAKTQSFYLKDNFIIRDFTPSTDIIPYEQTIPFSTPGVVAKNVAPVLGFSEKNNKQLEKQINTLKLLSKVTFETAVEIHPIIVHPYSFDLPFLEKSIVRSTVKHRNNIALGFNYFYKHKKKWQIGINFLSSISDKTMKAYSLGTSKVMNLDPFGNFNVSIGTHVGYRAFYDNAIEHTFNGDLKVQNKIFKKGKVDMYFGQKEIYVSPRIMFNCKISNRLSLNLHVKHYIPFNAHSSILVEDSKGFFRKSVHYKLNSKDLVQNDFGYTLGLVFGF